MDKGSHRGYVSLHKSRGCGKPLLIDKKIKLRGERP